MSPAEQIEATDLSVTHGLLVAEMVTGEADRGHLEQIKAEAEQIKAEAEQIAAEMATGGADRGHRKGREGHRKSWWSRSEPRWSPAKPGEPILVRDDHRRSLVIEVGTGESWRCRNPRQKTRKP